MRRGRLGVAIALAAMLSAVAGTASAQAAEQFAYCDPLAPAGAALYGDRGAAAAAVAGRGTTAREPDLGQTVTDMPASAKGKAPKSFKATVPVYFHVVTDGAKVR